MCKWLIFNMIPIAWFSIGLMRTLGQLLRTMINTRMLGGHRSLLCGWSLRIDPPKATSKTKLFWLIVILLSDTVIILKFTSGWPNRFFGLPNLPYCSQSFQTTALCGGINGRYAPFCTAQPGQYRGIEATLPRPVVVSGGFIVLRKVRRGPG